MEDFQRDIDPSTTTLSSGTMPDDAIDVLGDSQEVQDDDGAGDGEKAPDVLEWVRENPHLELLPRHSCKRQWPVRCLRCMRNCTKKLAVFDLVSTSNPKWYYQHVNGPTHKTKVALWKQSNQSKKRGSGSDPSSGPGADDSVSQPCQGFSVQCCKGTKLHEARDAFKLWLCYNSANALVPACDTGAGAHTYNIDAKNNDCIIFHHKCEKTAAPLQPGVRVLCARCTLLGKDRPILRMIGRFLLKHGAARALALCHFVWMKFCGMR